MTAPAPALPLQTSMSFPINSILRPRARFTHKASFGLTRYVYPMLTRCAQLLGLSLRFTERSIGADSLACVDGTGATHELLIVANTRHACLARSLFRSLLQLCLHIPGLRADVHLPRNLHLDCQLYAIPRHSDLAIVYDLAQKQKVYPSYLSPPFPPLTCRPRLRPRRDTENRDDSCNPHASDQPADNYDADGQRAQSHRFIIDQSKQPSPPSFALPSRSIFPLPTVISSKISSPRCR